MLEFLDKLRKEHGDDDTLIGINEIESELTSKKFGLVWEEHEEHIDVEMRTKIPVFTEVADKEIISDERLPYNFLLEGDNLHSLKLLEKTHKGKIDVIYIDPPYNTGAKDWKYDNNYVDKEDGFRHSKWLSMMHNRLEIAKALLKDDGALICAIDENELATTLLLLDDIFGVAYNIDCITVVHNPRGVQGKNFSYIHEYAIFVYKKAYKIIRNQEVELEDIDWSNFRNWGKESERSDAKNCFYSVIIKNGEIIGFGNVLEDDKHPQQSEYIATEENYYVYPIDIKGVERKWRYARQSVDEIKHFLRVKESTGRYEIEIGKNFASYKTVWTDKKYDANEYGTQLINNMVPKSDFDFPKSLYNVYDCLYSIIKDRVNAIVLDFFAGSGTTGHAVMLMNKNLGGNRKFILCTNNAVGEKREKEFQKQYQSQDDNVKISTDWEERYGIARSITYKRIKATIDGYRHSKDMKTLLLEKKLTMTDLKKTKRLFEKIEAINEAESRKYTTVKTVIEEGTLKVLGIVKKTNAIKGIPANLKYYKTDFIDKVYEDLDYSVRDELLKHIAEMVQLEKGAKIDGRNYILLLTDEETDIIAQDKGRLENCKGLYISSSVLLTSSQQKLFEDMGIAISSIPDYYFEAELREVGDL